MMNSERKKIIVIGTSAGGRSVLNTILSALPADFPVPVAVVQHLHKDTSGYHIEQYDLKCHLTISDAADKEPIAPGIVIFAPSDYHLLIENEKTYSLSMDEAVNFARPSIDVLFESAALTFGADVIGIILTGANHDGSEGLKTIKDYGGFVIVQDPETAEVPAMPECALKKVDADAILSVEEIVPFLVSIIGEESIHGKCSQHTAG